MFHSCLWFEADVFGNVEFPYININKYIRLLCNLLLCVYECKMTNPRETKRNNKFKSKFRMIKVAKN